MLDHELKTNHAILLQNQQRLEDNEWLAKPISFWMESIRFLISEMEIWDQLHDRAR